MEKKSVKLTNEQVLRLEKALASIGSIKGNAQFAMSVALNRSVLKPFVTALQEVQEPSEDYKKYVADQKELLQKHGEEMSVSGGNTYYEISKENLDGYKDALKALNEQYASALEEFRTQSEQLVKTILPSYVNGSDPVELYTFKAPLPDEVDGNTLFELMELIDS